MTLPHQSAFEQYFYTTVYLVAEKQGTQSSDVNFGSQETATGFIYRTDTTRGEEFFIVTNKHVFEGTNRLTIKMSAGDGHGGPDDGIHFQTTYERFGPNRWTGHPDIEVDVAVLRFTPRMTKPNEGGLRPFARYIGPGSIPTNKELDDMDAIEDVIFVGYPDGLYSSDNYLPIARRGMTATPVSLDYDGLPAFLIDASVHKGSSGSPVLHEVRKGQQLKTGEIATEARYRLLGVVAKYLRRKSDGSIVQSNDTIETMSEVPVGLGLVFKTKAIQTCVRLALKS